MPAPSYHYENRKPPKASFLEDVLAGLGSSPKSLPPKYFYDERGSHLFDRICELPEYYPTRTELGMLDAVGSEIAARLGKNAAIVEYGSGSGRKTAVLIERVCPLAYVAIDISDQQLRHAANALAAAYPRVRVIAVCADYTQQLDLPWLDRSGVTKRLVFFPGSTIGNFSVEEAVAFLANARGVAGRGGAMLVGVDLKKDVSVLHAAYNDAQGVTAAFNLNVLRRINDELGADFDLQAFEHRAFYNAAAGRIEMHLVSRSEQTVTIASHTFPFAVGETIHTESSYKYSVEEFQSLARKAGFDAEHCWVDPDHLFSIHYLTVPGVRRHA